jgi:hypothetical protein
MPCTKRTVLPYARPSSIWVDQSLFPRATHPIWGVMWQYFGVCLSVFVSEILGRYSPDFYIPRNMTVLSPSSFSLFLSLSAFLASSKPLQA